MIRRIKVPFFLQKGIRAARKGAVERQVFGFDTETVEGKPYTVQLARAEIGSGTVLRVSAASVMEKSLELMLKVVPSGSVLYAHNLEFDLPVLFFPHLRAFETRSSFRMQGRDFNVDILFGKVNHADIRIGSWSVELVDTFAFFKTSLAALTETFSLPPKLEAPPGLGKRFYHREGTDAWVKFQQYAVRDAEAAAALGEKIESIFKRFDVAPCISAPQLAARIFKRQFISKGASIPQISLEAMGPSLCSYHGGKNGFYGAAGMFPRMRVYDINSAYPHAMTKLPNFLGATYKWVKEWHGEGVYCISGYAVPHPMNLLRNHKFEPVVGDFRKVWVTSYELKMLVRQRWVNGLEIHRGYVVQPDPGVKENPLANFARYFYRLKATEKGPLREFYKIILNSLYGKFVQSIGSNDTGSELTAGETEHIAGGLFNPLIGTLITGYVRAYLTQWSMRYQGLHESTDSVMTRQRLPTGKKLGQMSLKASGTAIILRPKLYVLWNRDKEIVSYALHGYHGSLRDFIRMLRSGGRAYVHRRMWKVRESARLKKTPLTMDLFHKKLNLSVSGPLKIPRLIWRGKSL